MEGRKWTIPRGTEDRERRFVGFDTALALAARFLGGAATVFRTGFAEAAEEEIKDGHDDDDGDFQDECNAECNAVLLMLIDADAADSWEG